MLRTYLAGIREITLIQPFACMSIKFNPVVTLIPVIDFFKCVNHAKKIKAHRHLTNVLDLMLTPPKFV